MKKRKTECNQCDYENAVYKGRAHWCCPVCDRDFSFEYYFWYKATHPEWIDEMQKATDKLIAEFKKKSENDKLTTEKDYKELHDKISSKQ